MASSLPGQLVFLLENGHHVWEDQSLIKWRKRDAHVPLRCHDSIEGEELNPFQFQFRIWIKSVFMLLEVLLCFTLSC